MRCLGGTAFVAHPVQTGVGRAPDLRRVAGLVFFLDRDTYDYVREGTIWFDRLGTCQPPRPGRDGPGGGSGTQ